MKEMFGVVPSSLTLTSKNIKGQHGKVGVAFEYDAQLLDAPLSMLQPPRTGKASLGDRVWLDNNGNGRQDAGETGLAGIKVKLFNTQGQLVAQTLTDAKGQYLFNNLKRGAYKVQFEAPAGYTFSKQNQGNDTLDSDVNSNGISDVVNLRDGQMLRHLDAGLVKKADTAASIGDRVWLDSNGNGVQDAGEKGMAGVEITLQKMLPMVSATQIIQNPDGTTTILHSPQYMPPREVRTVTDANGDFKFSGLGDGEYQLQAIRPDAYQFTRQNIGDDRRDSDVNEIGYLSHIKLAAGQDLNTIDIGLVPRVMQTDLPKAAELLSHDHSLDALFGNDQPMTTTYSSAAATNDLAPLHVMLKLQNEIL